MQENNIKQLFTRITTFIFDVDGVLTDGSITLMPGGEMVRTMNIKDAYALQKAVKEGYRVAVITGGNSQVVKEKLEVLGIRDVFLRSHNKAEVLENYMLEHELRNEEIAFMGDDLPDYEVLQKVGLPCCPADAAHEIKNICAYISIYKGGKGCARDLVEQVMRVHDKWMTEDITW